MKDYYKILGVGEEASEEEIRQRWMELVKRYHPDVGRGKKNEERIKEINEAYEVLRDFSKRLDYDFKRDLKKSVSRKVVRGQEKRDHFPKIILATIGISLLLLIVGAQVIKWSPTAKLPKTEALYQKDQGISENRLPSSSPVKTEPAVKMEQNQPGGVKAILTPESKKVSSIAFKSYQSESGSTERGGSNTILKSESLVREEVSKEIQPEIQRESPIEVPMEVSKEVPKENPKETFDETQKEIARASPKVVPPPLIAREEEVRQFFSDYKVRYTQKDTQGFIALFSLRAIQNRKDGYEEIKKIYHHFFDQSKELQYHLDDPKVEIYENSVVIKARYRVDQILKKQGREKVWVGDIRWVLEREDGSLKIITLDYQHDRPIDGRREREK